MTMPALTPILNDSPGSATNIWLNFQTVQTHVNQELISRDGSVAMTAPLAGVAAVNPSEYVILSQLEAGVPSGIMAPYTASVAPAGWVLAQGQQVSETDPTYAALKTLYEADGYPYNDGGESAGNFRLPDMRQVFLRGKGVADALGDTGGVSDWAVVAHDHTMAHTHTTPNHTHAVGTLQVGNESSHTHMNNPPQVQTPAGQGSHNHGLAGGRGYIYYSSGANLGGFSGGTTGDGILDYWDGNSSGYGHTHTFTMADFQSGSGSAHNHPLTGETANDGAGTTGASSAAVTGEAGTGEDGVGKNLPPYLVLNHIIKL